MREVVRPPSRGCPIVVLSNNDGCVVARSDEAKALGIEMGVPLFEIKEKVKRLGIHVFSSNYALYGDLSERVMNTLRSCSPAVEVYSIDEAFCDLAGIADPKQWGHEARKRILGEIGITVCVGIARTKTLAKAANRIAKKHKERTGGVHVLADTSLEAKALQWLEIGDVWGIGHATTRKLQGYGIRNAADFAARPEAWVRRTFGVVLTRTWHELRGIPCSELCEAEPQRQRIRTSRSFEKCLTEIVAVEESISSFASRVAAKLRERHLCASCLAVFLQTNRFDQGGEQYMGYRTGTLIVPTNSTIEISNLALKLARTAYLEGFGFKKAGVEAWGLVPDAIEQQNLFDAANRAKIKLLQASMDTVTKRWGPEFLSIASAGTDPSWKMRRDHMSKRYTTSWSEVLEVDLDNCYRKFAHSRA